MKTTFLGDPTLVLDDAKRIKINDRLIYSYLWVDFDFTPLTVVVQLLYPRPPAQSESSLLDASLGVGKFKGKKLVF